jgi:hypothetical protein
MVIVNDTIEVLQQRSLAYGWGISSQSDSPHFTLSFKLVKHGGRRSQLETGCMI